MKITENVIVSFSEEEGLTFDVCDEKFEISLRSLDDFERVFKDNLKSSLENNGNLEALDFTDLDTGERFFTEEYATEIRNLYESSKKCKDDTIEFSCPIVINVSGFEDKLNNTSRFNELYINLSSIDDISSDVLEKYITDNQIDSNIKVMCKYNNYENVSFKELIETFRMVDEKIATIRNANLSPLEIVTALYLEYGKLVYKNTDDNTHPETSRDLTSILREDNDKIVCLGFANLFAASCNKLGVKCEVEVFKSIQKNRPGHASNVVFINDDKYNVHGPFAVDVTWGIRNNNSCQEMGKSLKHLFQSFDESEKTKADISTPLIPNQRDGMFDRLKYNYDDFNRFYYIELIKKYSYYLGYEDILINLNNALNNNGDIEDIYDDLVRRFDQNSLTCNSEWTSPINYDTFNEIFCKACATIYNLNSTEDFSRLISTSKFADLKYQELDSQKFKSFSDSLSDL